MSSIERALVPPPALAPFVSSLRVVRTDTQREAVWSRIPDPTAAVIVCRSWAGETTLAAFGPTTQASHANRVELPLYVRVELRPGAARALLGIGLHELVDRSAPLADLWGARAVRPLAEAGPDDAIAVLETLLIARATANDALASRSRILSDAVRPQAREGVPALAKRVGVSERQLRRLFHDEVGLAPRHHARIVRIRRVLARAGRESWARLAAEHGFSDQAHLSAEFHELVGVTPRAFLDRALAHASRCGSRAT